MPLEQDFKQFFESLGQEIIAVKDRVRSLIGDAHWGEDGRYREAVLKNVITRFLPKNYSMGTGFVINSKRQITSQIDIIVYDDSSPVLFSQGDFVIVPANTVKGIIEVKSTIDSTSKLQECIKTAEENAKIIEINFAQSDRMFNGIFCFNCNLSIKTLKESLQNYFSISECSLFRKVNNISLGEEKFIHLWDMQPFSLRGYNLKDLSFAYFISNLLTCLDKRSYENNSLFFPLDSKNPFEKFSIPSPPRKWDRYI